MAKKKGNFVYNYRRLKLYLQERGYDFVEYNNGHHFKIIGPTAAIELWTSKMTYHILESEEPHTRLYLRNILDINFNEKEMDNLL